MNNVAGLILAGGQSRRMGGGDKCLMPLQGVRLIERVSKKLTPHLSNILVNSNGNPADFAFLPHEMKSDVFEGFAGPLAGVLTGMRWAETVDGVDWIITAAADTPFFPHDYVTQMVAAAEGNDIVLAASNGRTHPVFGLWKVSLSDDLQAFLETGDRKVMLFVQNYRHHIAEFAVKNIDPFFNLNTPEDWKTADQFILESARD